MSNYPQAGDRAGSVCGPCQSPKDNAGTVITVYADKWYSSNALVIMDSGKLQYITGEYTKVGIGWYCIKQGVPA